MGLFPSGPRCSAELTGAMCIKFLAVGGNTLMQLIEPLTSVSRNPSY